MDAASIGHNSNIVVYDQFRAQLGGLRKINDEISFDYEDPKGNKQARSHVYKLRQTKSAVEKARKEEKAASLEYGRRVDEQAKEIVSEIDAMIEVHDKPLREIEQREKDRVAKLESDLAEIEEGGRYTLERWLDLPLESMKDRLGEIETTPIGENYWQEYALRAAQAKEAAIENIKTAIAQREKHDAEQAELERLRREAEAREQADREERIRQEAIKREREEAERKAQREREAAERRELELKLAAERAEREKVEAERRAELAAKETEERLKREAAEKVEKEAAALAAREADKKHRATINRAAADAFKTGGLDADAAKKAVMLIAQGKIPSVSISY